MTHRISTLFALLCLALAPFPASAGENAERERVLETVEAFMAAFDAKDPETMATMLTEDAVATWVHAEQPDVPAQSTRAQELVAFVASVPGEIAEPIEVIEVLVDGPVAMVWADFGFYLDGERSHCGVDIFTLVREGDEWKIATITYSHVTQACEDAPTP
ncbi:nuclear transport factor 2 family protein [Aurantiacibacter sp. MUD11]|uniref:nuclear transport factor 2 family protein n=1 Tax=Aurantiacibacter sp. MUD11 TaxID=3003265 RepID=UPI0022AB0EC3|nr:nuclear transport factor 2 family protein [Aurantiacibacter sp. MUD11]WAT17637.1 nuclear transport factor 2 family protein [Aurantiacibacter sp. MUD11]